MPTGEPAAAVSPRSRPLPALPPPLALSPCPPFATSLQLLPQFVSEAKLAVSWSPSFIYPPILSCWRLGWSQTNSFTADNTATARKEPNKWPLLRRPNGPAFHLARGQCSAVGLHGHQHPHLMSKSYKLPLAMTNMHHIYTHLVNQTGRVSTHPVVQ